MPCSAICVHVTEACNMPDEDLIRAERVSVGASAGRFSHPPAISGPDGLTLVHAINLVLANDGRPATWAE
jgi:hypothetical protein